MTAGKLGETAGGVFVIAATPFLEDRRLDFDSADRLVDFYLERGASGLTLLDPSAEASKLSAEESRSFVQRVLARVGTQVPVLVGASHPGLDHLRS